MGGMRSKFTCTAKAGRARRARFQETYREPSWFRGCLHSAGGGNWWRAGQSILPNEAIGGPASERGPADDADDADGDGLRLGFERAGRATGNAVEWNGFLRNEAIGGGDAKKPLECAERVLGARGGLGMSSCGFYETKPIWTPTQRVSLRITRMTRMGCCRVCDGPDRWWALPGRGFRVGCDFAKRSHWWWRGFWNAPSVCSALRGRLDIGEVVFAK